MSTNPSPKSFLRRHATKVTVLSVLLFIFIYVGVCALTILKVRAVRKQPRRSAAPGGRLARVLTFKIVSETIVEFEVIANPERLKQLNLSVLDE